MINENIDRQIHGWKVREREREKERKREREREKLSLIWMPEGITYFHAKFQVNILKNKRLFTTLNAFVEIIISRNKGKCIFALPLLRQNWIEQECPRCWVYLLADYLKNMQNRKKKLTSDVYNHFSNSSEKDRERRHFIISKVFISCLYGYFLCQ